MKALLVLYALVLLIVGVNAASLTPYGVPMFGFGPANTPDTNLTDTTTKNCQAITGVGDVKGFGLWVDATADVVYPADYTILVTMGVLTGSNDVVFARTVPAKLASTIPGTYQTLESGKTWRNYWAVLDATGLDPSATYIMCMTPACAPATPLSFAQTNSGSGALTITSGAVTSGSADFDLLFSIATTNIVVPANPSYSDAFLYTNVDCVYRTTYPLLQIDFENNLIDTSFSEGATTVLQVANYGATCPSTWPNGPIPLGQPNSCLYGSSTASQGRIDLRGTMWAVDQPATTWTVYGYAASGGPSALDAYNQLISLSISGSCGSLMPPAAYSDNNAGSTNYGGSYIGIVPVDFCTGSK